MKTWLKYGIIFGIIFILFAIFANLEMMLYRNQTLPYRCSDMACPIQFLFLISLAPSSLLLMGISGVILGKFTTTLWILLYILGLIQYFIIGIIIGLIKEKLSKRKRKVTKKSSKTKHNI